mgnify:CR=1 FL=1
MASAVVGFSPQHKTITENDNANAVLTEQQDQASHMSLQQTFFMSLQPHEGDYQMTPEQAALYTHIHRRSRQSCLHANNENKSKHKRQRSM